MEERDSDCSNFSDSMPATPKAKPFTKGELNDLVRDLALSKEAAEILDSRLSEHFVLDSEARITFYRKEMKYSFSTSVKKKTLCIATTSKAFF